MTGSFNRAGQWLRARLGAGQSEDYRRSLRNAVFHSGAHVLQVSLWLVATPLFLRRLGTDLFGVWMLVNGVLGMGCVLQVGLTNATIKFVSKYRALEDLGRAAQVVRTTFTMYVLLGILGGVVIYTISPYLVYDVFNIPAAARPVAVTVIRIASVGLLMRFVDSVFESGLHGFECYALAARVTATANCLTIAVNAVLVLVGFELPALLCCTVILLGGSALAKFWLLRSRQLPSLRLGFLFDAETLRETLGFGLYGWVQHMLGVVNANIDRLLIAAYLDTTALSYYTVALQVARQAHAVLAKAGSFIFPFTAKLLEWGAKDRLLGLYDRTTLLIAILSCGAVLPLFFWAESILTLWVGQDFGEYATPILQVLCVRYALLPLGIVNYNFMLGAGYIKMQTLIFIGGALAIAVGMCILVPVHGGLGAAGASLLGLPFLFVERYCLERKLFGCATLRRQLSYLLPVALPFAAAVLSTRMTHVFTLSIPLLVVGGVAVAVVGWLSAYGVVRCCQSVGWLPVRRIL